MEEFEAIRKKFEQYSPEELKDYLKEHGVDYEKCTARILEYIDRKKKEFAANKASENQDLNPGITE